MMDRIDEILESAFSIGPVIEDYLEPCVYFKEDYEQQFIDAYYEAVDNPDKGTIVDRIGNFIMSIIRQIQKIFNSIFNWLTSLFGGKKPKRSVDQIAASVVDDGEALSSSPPVIEDSKKGPGRIRSAVSNLVSRPQNTEAAPAPASTGGVKKAKGASKIKIRIFKNPASPKPCPVEIEALCKEIQVAFSSQDDTVCIINNNIHPGKYSGIRALAIITDSVTQTKLLDCCTAIKEKKPPEEVRKLWSLFVAKTGVIPSDSKTLTLKFGDIKQAQISLNKMSEALQAAHMTSRDKYYRDKRIVGVINELSEYVGSLQIVLNSLNTSFRNLYNLDGRYAGTVNDPVYLGMFAKRMSENGIPSAYIIQNMLLMASPALRGDGADGYSANPACGQYRLVLYPKKKKKIVYKIALNGVGAQKNITEANTVKKVHFISSFFPKFKGISNDGYVTTWERLDVDPKKITPQMETELLKHIKTHTMGRGIRLNFGTSIHGKVGLRHGTTPVCFDFGAAPIKTRRKPKLRPPGFQQPNKAANVQ